MGALRYRGMAAEKRGDLDLAEAMFLRAQNLAQRHGDPAEEAASVEHLGTVSRLQGDIEGSLRLLQDALAGFERVGQTRGLADCAVELAGTLVALGRPEEALPHAERAGALFGELQDLAGQASALNNHGDALRALGRHAEAERALHSAYEMLNRTGSQTRIFPLANLGLLAHGRGGHAEARGYLEAGLALAELRGRLSLAAWFQAVLLAPLAVLGEWEIWDARLEAAEGLLADTGFAEPDIPRHLEEAAGAARSAGHLQRASRAAALATDQYLALGDADSARRLEEAHARP